MRQHNMGIFYENAHTPFGRCYVCKGLRRKGRAYGKTVGRCPTPCKGPNAP